MEVIDTDGVCMGPALPHALFGAGGAGIIKTFLSVRVIIILNLTCVFPSLVMRNLAVICGGNDSGLKER